MTELAAENEIRTLIENRVQAVREKNVDKAMQFFTANVLSFDVVGPLRFSGAATIRQRVEEWFGSFEGPIGFDVDELNISASGDVAYSHSLNHVNAAKTDGKTLDMWWRSTVGYRKLNGGWVILHEHNSVPFDVASGKVSLDLKP
jgi:ketosteroid isomerase-like protein